MITGATDSHRDSDHIKTPRIRLPLEANIMFQQRKLVFGDSLLPGQIVCSNLPPPTGTSLLLEQLITPPPQLNEENKPYLVVTCGVPDTLVVTTPLEASIRYTLPQLVCDAAITLSGTLAPTRPVRPVISVDSINDLEIDGGSSYNTYT